MPSSGDSSAGKGWASLTGGSPPARASAPACWRASAAFTVKRSGLIISTGARGNLCADFKMPNRQTKRQNETKSLLRLFYEDLLRDPLTVHDELIDVDAGRGRLARVRDEAVPIPAVRAAQLRGTAEREAVERFARAAQHGNRNQLGEDVVNPYRHDGPVTLEEQLPAQLERNRGHRIRSEEHTSELQSRSDLVCRLLLEKKKNMMSMKTEYILYTFDIC